MKRESTRPKTTASGKNARRRAIAASAASVRGRRVARAGKSARSPRAELIPEPSVQLEELAERFETPYHRALSAMGRCLLPGLALFAAVTAFEAGTGTLARMAGTAWLERVGRLPGVLSGQGNLSEYGIVPAAIDWIGRHPTRLLMVGDSVLGSNLGGGAVSEVVPDDAAAAQVAGTLNLSHEGLEWATAAFIIDGLLAEHARRPGAPALPPLVIDVNPKFFGLQTSLTPAIPIELEACSHAAPVPGTEPEREAICASLSNDWPAALRALSGSAPAALRGLLGQFDFLMTFAMRFPLYHATVGHVNHRGLGRDGIRFRSGIADAQAVSAALRAHPPDFWPQRYDLPYIAESLNQYEDAVLGNYNWSDHPKHAWLRSLARVAARWPAPVYALYIRPSPAMEAVLTPDRIKSHRDVRDRVHKLFADAALATGKKDLQMIDNHEFATDPNDFADHDHLSPGGHRKLAGFLNRTLGSPR